MFSEAPKKIGDGVLAYRCKWPRYELGRLWNSYSRFAPSELTGAFNQWHAAAKTFLREGQTKDEYRMEFLNGYRRVRHPLGNRSLQVALEQACTDPLPVSAREFEDERIQLLIAWCWQLQKHVGDHQSFYLSCRDCGKELSISHVTAAQWLSGLCAAEILRETEKGSQQTGKASRYRFIGGASAAVPVAENEIENELHSGSSTL